MTRIVIAFAALVLVVAVASAPLAPAADDKVSVQGLEGEVTIDRDAEGVPHLRAHSERDAYFAIGYLHAQDRLFQMDHSRRQASGTLAELLGPGALSTDVQLRTLGLRRAAQRSLAVLSPDGLALLEAYSDGVNASVESNPLPSEYTPLELTKAKVPAWTPLDSVVVSKLLAFGLSFDDVELANTQRLIAYQTAGAVQGFNGSRLFFEDMMRSEPFAHAASILPGETSDPVRTHGRPDWSAALSEDAASAVGEALENAEQAGVPTQPGDKGSNVWVVSGARTASGRPIVANDPHLSLSSPPVFYEAGIDVDGGDGGDGGGGGMTLYGVTFPGVPGIVQGTNGHVSWGSTVNPTDVTDFYSEQLTIASGVPVATTHLGQQEPTQIIPQTFRANQPGNGTADDLVTVSSGVPPATIVVPRRNNGPLLSVTGTTGISVQYTGFSATRELDFFRRLTRARDVGEAIDAQRYFDVGAQNWMYADDRGNIGYKTSAEIPLREDLQAGTVTGLPPYFVRNGTGGNEWIPDPSPAEDQALGYEILPFDEMDGLVNPERGWIANANQDPTGQTFDNNPLNELRPGGGIRYITPGHSDGNRNTRISTRIEDALAQGPMTFEEMQSIQSDVKLNDAKVLVPYITAAFDASQAPGAPAPLAALGADPKVAEAISRLAGWDFSTPTGIADGYDASDVDGARATPTPAEVSASVAAAIYSLWRGRAVVLFVDAPLLARGIPSPLVPRDDQSMSALRHMLEGNGTGASGIVFFASPAARDTMLLQAVRNALDLAASAAFAPAFGGSTDLGDYRWGKLHRITFNHSLGGPFSIPPGAGFSDLAPGLPGVATDGGFGVVDASSHSPRASTLNGFRFSSGPARRFVSEALRSHPRMVQVIPGGESGNPLGPWFGNQLGRWLTDDYHAATTQLGEIQRDAIGSEVLVPAG